MLIYVFIIEDSMASEKESEKVKAQDQSKLIGNGGKGEVNL